MGPLVKAEKRQPEKGHFATLFGELEHVEQTKAGKLKITSRMEGRIHGEINYE